MSWIKTTLWVLIGYIALTIVLLNVWPAAGDILGRPLIILAGLIAGTFCAIGASSLEFDVLPSSAEHQNQRILRGGSFYLVVRFSDLAD